jgi:hypothetical protein
MATIISGTGYKSHFSEMILLRAFLNHCKTSGQPGNFYKYKKKYSFRAEFTVVNEHRKRIFDAVVGKINGCAEVLLCITLWRDTKAGAYLPLRQSKNSSLSRRIL